MKRFANLLSAIAYAERQSNQTRSPHWIATLAGDYWVSSYEPSISYDLIIYPA